MKSNTKTKNNRKTPVKLTDEQKKVFVEEVEEMIEKKQIINFTKFCEDHNITWPTGLKLITAAGVVIPAELKAQGGKGGKKKAEMVDATKLEAGDAKINISLETVPEWPECLLYNYSWPMEAISAILIVNRHDVTSAVNSNKPDLYIYMGPIASDKIHNYEYLYNHAMQFIKDQVIGKAKKLKVYTTGLVQCNAAVIKAAMDSGIALSFMNYDNSICRYKEQVIIPSENGDCGSSLIYLYTNSKRTYKVRLVKHPEEDFINLDKIYVVKVDDKNNVGNNGELYICTNISDMFSMYEAQAKQYLDNSDRSVRIRAEEIVLNRETEQFRFGHIFGDLVNVLE